MLVLLDRKASPSTRAGRSLWGVQRSISFTTGPGLSEAITVPAGFVTDLASIPRLVWSFYPPDGPWVKAAVIHDFLYYTCGDGVWHKHLGVTRNPPYTRAEADAVFKEAMRDRGVGAWARTVIWGAVRLGGGRGWGLGRRPTSFKREEVVLDPSELV